MTEEEAIKDLEEMKTIEYNPETKSEVIETVLNLLKKKDRQLYERNNRIRNLEKECQKHFDAMMDTISENSKKDKNIQRMQELLDLSDAKNVEKDKIIDLMAEKLAKNYLSKPKICTLKQREKINCSQYNNCVECIKQYFKSKVGE